ncbi:MAG: hypothetical protein NWQ18_06195, partial [Saprospiraceae bacterium]|nr:hypothetical protein [Saprospiraceae bacterium]
MNLSDYNQIPSPAFVLDLKRFARNLDLLKEIQEKANINIILALKGFSLWHVFPIIKKYLASNTTAVVVMNE